MQVAGLPRASDDPPDAATQEHHHSPGSVERFFIRIFHFMTNFCAGEDIVFLATDINLPGAVDWVMMQSCFEHHFMLVLEKQEKYEGSQLFYAIVQLIGTRKQAENFAYRYFRDRRMQIEVDH
jgi:hypothetical protein